MRKELWAPTVEFLGGRWLAFAAIRVATSPPRYCIYRFSSPSPLGPFAPESGLPVVCGDEPGGAIDPDLFIDASGAPYLLWKTEGQIGKTPTRIWARPLAADGRSFTPGSSNRELLRTSARWEMSDPLWGRGVVENPSMVRHRGRYLLFYSGNEYADARYATGYATCSGPLGPCTKRTTTAPLLASQPGRWGPGGGDAFVDERGNLMLAYHAWDGPGGQQAGAWRTLHLADLEWDGSKLVVQEAVDARGNGPDSLWTSRPDGTWRSSPQSFTGATTLVAGQLTAADGADDLLLYGTGDAPDVVRPYAPGGLRQHDVAVERPGSFLPLVGDFDGNGIDDVFWYAPGVDPGFPDGQAERRRDGYWYLLPDRRANSAHDDVADASLPFVGDFDGNGVDDIFWYAPGPAADLLWLHQAGGGRDVGVAAVGGFYRYPVVGDFDGNGCDDVLWYAPGPAPDHRWSSCAGPDGGTVSTPQPVNGEYVPVVGDFEGDGADDILWYGPGSSPDYEWRFSPGQATHRDLRTQVAGNATAVVADLDGDGRDDIVWYS